MTQIHPDVPLPVEPPENSGGSARAHRILLIFLGAVIVIWLLTGFYKVRADQVAIVERLGQYVTNAEGNAQLVGDGLHYHLPWPIDRVHIVSTQQQFTMKVDEFNASPKAYEDFKLSLLKQNVATPMVLNAIFNPYLITSDKSIANVEIGVSFQINDPEAWLNSVSHDYQTTYDDTAYGDMRNALFQHLAQRTMVQSVATMNLDMVTRERREVLQRRIMDGLSRSMTFADPSKSGAEIKLGVQVQKVEISEAHVPEAVKPAFDDLISQQAKRDEVIERAKADKKGLIVKAEGEKQTLIIDAEVYRDKVKQAANGERSRFEQVLTQYRAAPEQMRFNLWVDALRPMLTNTRRTFFPNRGDVITVIVEPPQFEAGQPRIGQ